MMVFALCHKSATFNVKNLTFLITFEGGEFIDDIKSHLTLTPFAHFYRTCNNRWGVLDFLEIDKSAIIDGRG